MLKKAHLLLFASVCLIVLITNSCKKDPNMRTSATETSDYLKDYQPVKPYDIASWVSNNLSQSQQEQLQFPKSQQSVINKHHVVRIPIGKDAALFFTKTGGKMQVYAYKWLNKNPGNKTYTGYIAAYSFESHKAKQFEYSNSKKINENYLQVKTSNSLKNGIPNIGTGADPATSQGATASVGAFLDKFWCWLTNGTYISQQDINNGNSAGANGEVGKVGCDYQTTVSTISNDDLGNGDFSWLGNDNFSTTIPNTAGSPPIQGGSTGFGDGTQWVNIYVPAQGCCVNPNIPCITICQDAYWNTYEVTVAYREEADDARLLGLLKQEDAKDDIAMSPCHGTARNGNVQWPGTAEHWLIQYDYMASNPSALREYFIPGSSSQLTGSAGYADIADPSTNQMFEIKPNNEAGQTAGAAEVQLYVTQGNLLCPPPNGGSWAAGGNYASRYLPDPKNPSNLLFARLFSNGVIVYSSISKNGLPDPTPVALPQNLADKLKALFQQIQANPSTLQQQVITFVRQNPSIVPYLKSAAAGVIIGTILEDIATDGVGILNDWESFLIARTLWRVAGGIIIINPI